MSECQKTADSIWPTVEEIARTAGRNGRPQRARIFGDDYLVEASQILDQGRPIMVVVMRPTERRSASRTALRNVFQLTEREAEVAELLAERFNNTTIAGRLSISKHTARHHTEAVLLKLGVRRRSAVSERVAALVS